MRPHLDYNLPRPPSYPASRRLLFAVCVTSVVSCTVATKQDRDLYYHIQGSGISSYQYEKVCSLHHAPTRECAIPAYGGMALAPADDYIRARIANFPNSYLDYNTGWCTQGPVLPAVRWVCPSCRTAELRWRRAHAYPIPNEVTSPEWQCFGE